MAVETSPITDEQLFNATTNYIECLAPPKYSQLLVITDRMLQGLNVHGDRHQQVRIAVTDRLTRILGKEYPLRRIDFDSTTSKQVMHNEADKTLQHLDEEGAREFGEERVTTVVYMGDAWLNREGMYDAITEFAEDKPQGRVRVAGSLGFSTGDCRVMSQMGPKERESITQAGRYFTGFFQTHPFGRLEISTNDGTNPYLLSVNYDVAYAPFETELGRFDETNLVFNRKFVYWNTPGGETFAAPYPYKQTAGRFIAEGIVFSVKGGLIIKAEELRQGAVNHTAKPSQLLFRLVQSGKKIPLSELGLGFYALAGIKTYPDSSILSREKSGPHIGMGHGYTSIEEAAIAQAAGDFHHTDFVLENPIIRYKDQPGGESIQFYPPN